VNGCESAVMCPYFEQNDPRCAARFNLDRIRDVFEQCLGDYTSCPIYFQLTISIQSPGTVALAAATR